ncbi:hypothetical protein AB0K60_28210 [Thermopolyspora sp. NPDC052614]|uniref:hypothetical protein n=1 Tax=Thermopolyspora sp. NPDC052614 TaxID=3155682 RepID=UPI0034300AA2
MTDLRTDAHPPGTRTAEWVGHRRSAVIGAGRIARALAVGGGEGLMRYAPTVPRPLGHRDRDLPPDELNPHPHPFP